CYVIIATHAFNAPPRYSRREWKEHSLCKTRDNWQLLIALDNGHEFTALTSRRSRREWCASEVDTRVRHMPSVLRSILSYRTHPHQLRFHCSHQRIKGCRI